jgi:plasmid replication initiation protein
MRSQELIKLENNLLIRQHNAITGARHGMSATEQNIMYMLISQLRDDDPKDKLYSISVSDLDKLSNSQVNYSHLKEASQKLIGKVYRIRTENEMVSFAPLNFFMYKKGKGKIELKISDEIRPFFFALKNNYTRFQFQMALKLKSKYSKRMYEMLSQFKNTGIFKISLQELKERFELIDPKTGKEEYEKFGLFATYVLEVAKKEINEHTEIHVEYSTEKTGRKITHLHFKITSKEVIRELAEPALEDSEVEKLKDRLVTKFKLSKTLAKKIIENIPPREIGKILVAIQFENGASKLRNIGAYATTVFQNRLDGAVPIAQNQNTLKYISLKPVNRMPIENHMNQNGNLEKAQPIEYQKSIATDRSTSSASIGDLLTQIGVPKKVEQMNSTFSKEEKEDKAAKAKEKYVVWRKLYNRPSAKVC